MLGKMDDEDCFGFHSEYYVAPDWRKDANITDMPQGPSWKYTQKGYACYSKYQNDIYFIAIAGSYNIGEQGVYVVKSNVRQKTSSVVRLATQKVFDSNTYIAVNRQGYFLYDTKEVTLFGFDGREISTHKFGQVPKRGMPIHVECIYIYDDKVIYSETKQAAMSTRIYSVNMLTGEKTLVWGAQKGDFGFDEYLRESYRREWGTELPFSQAPSNIENISCRFLYANERRVVAGYTRSAGNEISYIVHIDLAAGQWDVLDCFARPSWKAKINEDSLPSWDARRIFSFHMLDDSMWVKTDDKDIRLVHTEIQRVAQLRGKYSLSWKLCAVGFNDSRYYYFDGKFTCVPAGFEVYRLKQDGEKKKISSQYYHNLKLLFWCFDDIYLIPNEQHSHRFQNIANGSVEYELDRRGIEELLQNTEQPEPKAKAESRKADEGQPSGSVTADMRHNLIDCGPEDAEDTSDVEPDAAPPVGGSAPHSAGDIQSMMAKAAALVHQAVKEDQSGHSFTEDEIQELVMTAFQSITEVSDERTASPAAPAPRKAASGSIVGNHRLTLAEFRQNAPSMTGFREQLLAYRKSLPNNWDYNAFVGILLGVGGPKHGDAACMNFAIGQGDNGNNTKKTLEARGLMSVFTKYRGKKIDGTILLSDVEDEIIAIVPEYAPIRQKLHEITKG